MTKSEPIRASKHAPKRTALVTGGAQGIGSGIAEVFVQHGFAVAILDQKPALGIVRKLREAGGDVEGFVADITKSAQVARSVRDIIKRFVRIDVLVNNAGTCQNKTILETTEGDWDEVMNVNLKGAFFCCQAVLPTMIKQRRGRIINISSIVARRGAIHGHVHYAASKAGLHGLTRTLALWAARYGITVNAVAPGSIDTELLHKINSPEKIHDVMKHTPLRRLGTPADVGELVAFLASDAACNMTGVVIDINGGQWIG